jgi:hypothetical protein
MTSTSIKPIGSNSLSQTNSVSNRRKQSLRTKTTSKTITIPSEIVVVSEGLTQESDTIITFSAYF